MYLYLLIIIVLCVIGVIYFNGGQKEHYVNRYAGRNECGELDAGPMDRPKIFPSCFAYRINTENEKIYGALDKVSKGLDKEISRSNNLDNIFYELATSNNNKINQLMKSSTVSGVKDNLGAGSTLLSASTKSNLIDPKLLDVYNLNEQETENIIRTAVEQHIANLLDNVLERSGINFNDSVAKVITNEVRNKIITPIIAISLAQVNRNVNRDIVNVINEVIQKADIDTQINNLVDIAINNDKRVQSYLEFGRNKQLRLGDFVYFRHKLDKAVEAICADGPAYQEIIVGGKLCDIDVVNKMASISYNIIINPNKNPRCQGLASSNPAEINYDMGVEGIPKWYPMSSNNKPNSCGIGLPDKLACEPNQWNDSSDAWVSEWIGGFDRKNNRMGCGVSPKNFNLPEKIPIAALSKDLEKLLQACKQNYDVIGPTAGHIKLDKQSNDNIETMTIGVNPQTLGNNPIIKKSSCEDRCLNIANDNNNPNRAITSSNGAKYYIKNNMFYKDNNAYPMLNGVVPQNIFKRKDQNTIFIYGSDNKYYKLSKMGIVALDNIDLDELGGNPDNSNCCFPVK